MKITMLGTGHAGVMECYNTCFCIDDDGKFFLVDAGGGNTILRQLKLAGINVNDIHHIFITHRHTDHITGMIWLLRRILSRKDDETVYVYSHHEVIEIIRQMAQMLFPKEWKRNSSRLFLREVADGESVMINDRKVTFFDIQSNKADQFGFEYDYAEGRKLVCCGDEPYHECELRYVNNADWLMHEAFCKYEDRDRFKPYEKSHSTVKDACELSERMNVGNLILYHTEDSDLVNRKKSYTEEGRKYYHGNLIVPDDLEVIEL